MSSKYDTIYSHSRPLQPVSTRIRYGTPLVAVFRTLFRRISRSSVAEFPVALLQILCDNIWLGQFKSLI